MRLVAFLAAVIIARPLLPAASGYTTAIDNAGNVWRTGEANMVMNTATAFQKTAVSSVSSTEDLSSFQGPTPLYCKHAYLVEQDGWGMCFMLLIWEAAARMALLSSLPIPKGISM